MHQLLTELVQYHRKKAKHLAQLQRFVNDVRDSSSPQNVLGSLAEIFDHFQNRQEFVHHHNEELILAELQSTSIPIHRRVSMLTSDHDALNRMTIEISRRIFDTETDKPELFAYIDNFVTIYCDHADGEESIFFPMASQVLKQPHWTSIGKNWK